jgi:hypothetical protein
VSRHVHLKPEPFDERCRSIAALIGSLSPVAASDQNNPAVLTSHAPWLAPTGHRQPTAADLPPEAEILSAWERQQQVLDIELDRRLFAAAADLFIPGRNRV